MSKAFPAVRVIKFNGIPPKFPPNYLHLNCLTISLLYPFSLYGKVASRWNIVISTLITRGASVKLQSYGPLKMRRVTKGFAFNEKTCAQFRATFAVSFPPNFVHDNTCTQTFERQRIFRRTRSPKFHYEFPRRFSPRKKSNSDATAQNCPASTPFLPAR